MTWTEPEPLTFVGGEPFSSPAAGSVLIRSRATGTLLWFGNISPENPDGNRPRYPLVVAEVCEETVSIKQETVSVIDDREEGDSEWVQFSNFRVHQL